MLCFPLLFAADVIRWANYTTQPIAGILESWCHTSHQLTPTLTCWITKNLTPMRPTSAEQTRLFRVPRLLLVSWTGLGLGDRPWSRGPALVSGTGLGLGDRPGAQPSMERVGPLRGGAGLLGRRTRGATGLSLGPSVGSVLARKVSRASAESWLGVVRLGGSSCGVDVGSLKK